MIQTPLSLSMVRRAVPLFLGVLLLEGCATSTPLPEQHTYLLRAVGTEGAVSAPESPVSVDRVTIPAYLNRNELVVLVSPRQIRAAKHHRWAEPLDSGIQRYLQNRLIADMGATSPRQRIRVEVQVEELIGDLDGTIDLRATYQIGFAASGQTRKGLFASSVEQQFDGYAGLVAGFETLLDALAGVIAQTIHQNAR